MKKYEKPVVMINEELAEGVYAASGDCYTFNSYITQTPTTGMDYYTIQINGVHAANDNHHSSVRTVKIVFNQNVTYKESLAASVNGSGSSTLYLEYVDGVNGSYHNNGSDNIGLGNLTVYADEGLSILSTSCSYCNMDCTYEGH